MRRKINNKPSCAFCHFTRALAFSGIGAAVCGLTAKWLGADQQTIIISAMMGSIGLVGWVTRKRKRKRKR